jgi:hypothetical protein
MNASGPYELLGHLMLRAHGSVKEIRLLEKTKDFHIVFGDGTQLSPRSESNRKEWYLGHRDVLIGYVNAGYGGDPLHVLAFGYSGTGSHNLAVLLQACGFKDTSVITAENGSDYFPLVLLPSGELVGITGTPLDLKHEREKREAEAKWRRDEEEKRRAEDQRKRQEEDARKEAEEKMRRAAEKRGREQEEADKRAETQRRKPIIEERKRSKACVMCGQPLGFLDKVRSRDRHSTCLLFRG